MLTGFTWCIPLKTKTADEVVKAYLDHIYSLFGGSVKIMTDNGTEFKNKLFKEVHCETRHGIFNSLTTMQAAEQWEDRGIPQVPKGVHWQAH